MLRWLSRCFPGISTLLLLVLLAFAFGDVETLQHVPFFGSKEHTLKSSGGQPPVSGTAPLKLKFSQKLFIFYFILTHVDTFFFALRLFFSSMLVTRKIKETLQKRENPLPQSDSELELYRSRENDVQRSRLRSGMTVPKPSELLQGAEVIHAIIIPNYGEEVETLQTTLAVLASHSKAVSQYEVRQHHQPLAALQFITAASLH
jgi:hypothetical protein